MHSNNGAARPGLGRASLMVGLPEGAGGSRGAHRNVGCPMVVFITIPPQEPAASWVFQTLFQPFPSVRVNLSPKQNLILSRSEGCGCVFPALSVTPPSRLSPGAGDVIWKGASLPPLATSPLPLQGVAAF